jgi:hypothetical protein
MAPGEGFWQETHTGPMGQEVIGGGTSKGDCQTSGLRGTGQHTIHGVRRPTVTQRKESDWSGDTKEPQGERHTEH